MSTEDTVEAKRAQYEADRAEYEAALAEGKIPMSEASELLTGGEIGLIEQHFKTFFDPDKMSPVSMMMGIIWALKRRAPVVKGEPRADWTTVENMTMREYDDYFAPEPPEFDDESESGKDEPADESEPAPEP